MHKKRTYILILVLAFCLSVFVMVRCMPAQASTLEQAQQEAEENADKLDEYRQQQRDLDIQLEQLKDQRDAQQSLADDYMVKISYLETQMSLIQQQIDVSQQAIDEAETQIKEAEAQIADAEQRLAERQALLEQRVVSLYKYGDISMLDVVFKTDSFDDFLVVYDMTQSIMDQDQELLSQIKEERAVIQTKKDSLEATKADLLSLQHNQEDQKADLLVKQNDYQAALSAANVTIAQLDAQEDEIAAVQESVSEEIRTLLASSNNMLTFGGVLAWPLPANYTYVSSPFGYRTHPIYGTTRFHTGIDIPADGGTSIYAAADGEILFKGWQSGYGNTVMIDHGNSIVTLYGHQSAFGDFDVGDYVVQGDVIGYVGTTGASTGNHLHFEVRVNGEAVDPYTYLNP